MSEAFDAQDAVLVRRNTLFLGLAASPAMVSVVSILAGLFVDARLAAFSFPFFVLAMLATFVVWSLNPRPKTERVALRADREGLRVDTGLFVSRAELREGLFIPAKDGDPHVQLRRRMSVPIVVRVRDEGEGQLLLRALGLDASQRVASFFGMSRVYASFSNFVRNVFLLVGGPALLGALAARLHFFPFAVAAALVFIGAYVSFFMPMRVKVGADGVIVSWYGRKRFIGYADVELSSVYEGAFGTSNLRGISLILRSGEEVRVPLGYGYWDSGRAAIVEARIREAMDAFHQGGAAGEASLLSRGERDLGDWIVALRQVGSGAHAGPRTAAVPRDTLWRIVENPSCKSTTRAAAAVALGATLDDEERSRMQTVAQATAAPKLRIAIESVAGAGDDEALAGALAELEAADEEGAEASA